MRAHLPGIMQNVLFQVRRLEPVPADCAQLYEVLITQLLVALFYARLAARHEAKNQLADQSRQTPKAVSLFQPLAA